MMVCQRAENKNQGNESIEKTEALLIVLDGPARRVGKQYTMSSSDSSFSSSFFSSSFGASAAAAPPAPPADGPTAAGAPPPDPTFDSSSLTFLPSKAFASSDAHIGSSSTLAAFVRVIIFSDWKEESASP